MTNAKTHGKANSGKSSEGIIKVTHFDFQGKQVSLKTLVEKMDALNVSIGKSTKETYVHYIDQGEILHAIRAKYDDNKKYSEAKLKFDDDGTISKMPQQQAHGAMKCFENKDFILSTLDGYIASTKKVSPYSLGYFWKNMQVLIHENKLKTDTDYKNIHEAKELAKSEAQEANEAKKANEKTEIEIATQNAIAFHTRFLNLAKSKSDTNKIDFIQNEICLALELDLKQLVEMLLPTINLKKKVPFKLQAVA